jgi:copper chaperone NosL
MTIVDPKFGGEVITKKGKVYKFDDIACLVHFLKSGIIKETNIAQKLLINYQRQNDFVEVSKAFLLVSPELKTPMGGNAAAFVSQEEAEKLKSTAGGQVMTWSDVFNKSE